MGIVINLEYLIDFCINSVVYNVYFFFLVFNKGCNFLFFYDY